ncbi:uracil-DNA glycosylase-like protein [Lipomyces oligophaga]|uniref:uracil-DNA glycosylase-like protein n=1 Tax=Lipomyces oligophaga TaxID=45792 RepID=UPI0034CF8D45
MPKCDATVKNEENLNVQNGNKDLSFHGLLDKFASKEVDLEYARAPSKRQHLIPTTSSSISANQCTSQTKKKRKRVRGYAPPSQYAHLSPVPDRLGPNLICIFVGLNPGVATAKHGHMFANPTNLFWPLMSESGCVSRRVTCIDDESLPQNWDLGITNLVSRPTAEQSELSQEEMVAGTPSLEAKLIAHSPEIVCIVGKGIWESIYKFKTGRKLISSEFTFGFQSDYGFDFASANSKSSKIVSKPKIFVIPSTSGRVAAYSRAMKSELWAQLGNEIQLVRRSRQENVRESAS